MKKITFVMVVITITLSFGMSIFSSPLLANTEKSNSSNSGVESRSKYLNIITVNKPQYEMVKKIVKDKHNVDYMFTDEKDINDFKYSQEVLDNVSNMDLFIYSGTNFEPWTNTFINELKKGNLGIINLSRGIRTLNYEAEGTTKENPYYFEGIEEYKISLYNVKAAIQDRDPQNRDFYEDNYKKAINEFEKQINQYKNRLEALKEYKFVTLDGGFDYLTKSLGLDTLRLDNHEISEFMKLNNLDVNKTIIIVDGEYLPNMDLSKYYTVKLWKYYGDMSFDDLIMYNVNELCNLVKEEQVQENKQ